MPLGPTIQSATLTVDGASGRFSFLAGQAGWKDIALGITSHCGVETANGSIVQHADGATLHAVYQRSGLRETAVFTILPSGALVVERRLDNPGQRMVSGIRPWVGMHEGRGRPNFTTCNAWGIRCAHQDNLRTELLPWCRPEFPYIRPLPRDTTRFGHQESLAAPYFIHLDDAGRELLLEGQLRQDRTRLEWQVAAAPDNALYSAYRVEWNFVGSGGACVQPGEELALEPVWYAIHAGSHPQYAIDPYFAELAARNQLQAGGNPLADHAFYCSWNYGIFGGITEESLLTTARVVARELPGIRWFLVDAGWQKGDPVACPHGMEFFEDEGEHCDHARFPSGMRGLAEAIRATGLQPALWWTPAVRMTSALARAHPEWLAQAVDGQPYRIGDFGYLDYSLPEVQRFLEEVVFATIFRKWGFTAMKMDFWSQSAESNQIRYHRGTGVQWRDWLLAAIRRHLPKDGFLMTCVATAMGNPFLGKSAHTYRACIDVGACARWQDHVYAMCWLQGLLAFPGRSTCLMNADGLGISPTLSDDENLHRLTYGHITQGSLEIDGRLEELSPRQLAWLRRLTSDIDRGHPVRCPDGQAFTGEPYPSALYVEFPVGSRTRRRGVAMQLALFNWQDTVAPVTVDLAAMGVSSERTVRDYWTGKAVAIPAGGLYCQRLPAHGARLLEICD